MAVVDAYIRVSKRGDREGASFISPLEQREAIETWAAANGFEIRETYEEINESGANAKRPHLLAALDRIDRGESVGVVSAFLDRFFRSQLDGLLAVDRIRKGGGFFVSADGEIDTRNESGDMLLGIRLSIAQDERRRKRDSFAAGRRRAVARGIHPCPVPPFGYTRPEDEKGKVLGPLEPHALTAPLVTELYKRAARGESWAALGRWLESEHALTAYGCASWTARAVKDLVRNRVYLGEAHHGEFVNKTAHAALTDELTFRQAQRVGRILPSSRGDKPALLSGLIRCAGCQRGMASFLTRSGEREYRCRRKYAGGVCGDAANVRAGRIEPYIEQVFFEALDRDIESDAGAPDEDLVALEQAWRNAEADLAAFRDDPQILATLGAADFAAGVNARRQVADTAEQRYMDRRAELAAMPDLNPVELRDAWPQLTVEEKREMLAVVFDTIFLRRLGTKHAPIEDFTVICLRGEAPAGLPRRGMRRGAPVVPLEDDWQPRAAAAA